MLEYTVFAVLSVVVVVALELFWLRTGVFRTLQYWLAMAIVLGFQVPVDGASTSECRNGTAASSEASGGSNLGLRYKGASTRAPSRVERPSRRRSFGSSRFQLHPSLSLTRP